MALIWTIGVVVYQYLVTIRWFGTRGFTISLFVAFVGFALMAMSLIASRGYGAARASRPGAESSSSQ